MAPEFPGIVGSSLMGPTFGSLLVSSWLACMLSGVVYLQAYLYLRTRPKDDHPIFGAIVVLLGILDVTHVVCIMTSCYQYFIKYFGQIPKLEIFTPTLALTVGFTALITFVVQCFFALRVWKLSQGNKWITALILAAATGRLAWGWVTSVKALQYGSFNAFMVHIRWMFTIAVSLAVAGDVIITASVYHYLTKSKSGMQQMDAILDKIILYTIETGLSTSLVSIAALVCALTMPQNLVFISIHFVIGKLYINSLLASLNSRNYLRSQCLADPTVLSTSIRFSTMMGKEGQRPQTPESAALRRGSTMSQPPRYSKALSCKLTVVSSTKEHGEHHDRT